jgi:hypothetical protein
MTIATGKPLIIGPVRHAVGYDSGYERCGTMLLGAPLFGLLVTSHTCNKKN